ncbi:MAG: hypothetical protein FWD46_03900 [Cystobacterineae bacterium]|nr:hypothetical protein [Cystobacterineae bacterium]
MGTGRRGSALGVLWVLVVMLAACQDEGQDFLVGPKLGVSLAELVFDSGEAGEKSFNLVSNTGWTASCTSEGSWCRVEPSSGSGNAVLTVKVQKNSGDTERRATVVFRAGPAGATVDITQAPLLQPRLTRAQFSNDCTSMELWGEPGIQPPLVYASSTGAIDTLCPEGLSGNNAGFRCPLRAEHFVPNTHAAHWTVQDNVGGKSTSPAYAFQTTLTNTESLFPLEHVNPEAVLGRDGMVGRQTMTSAVIDIGSPHASGGCWGGTALRGSIVAGYEHTCALQNNGTVRCWGITKTDGYKTYYGQTDVPAGLRAIAIAAGQWHTCVLQADGRVRCWGRNGSGQATVSEDLRAVAIAAGGWHTCALQVDSTVSCWGSDNHEATTVPEGLRAVAIAAGESHTCALRANGTVSCWGYHTYQQTDDQGDLGAIAIAAGQWHTCALRADSTVHCWGYNGYRQTDVPPGLHAVAIAAGDSHTCALHADGTVSCWGLDSNDQSTVPVGLNDAVAIAAGGHHTCALRADGTVRCWGNNGYGQADNSSGAAVQTTGQLVVQP